MRTIRVTGKGMIRVHPDMTRIMITLQGFDPEYGETLRRSSEETEVLRDALNGLGFDRSDLKTLSFDVETQYEYEDRTTYKKRFVGYTYEHRMKVDFESDNQRLGRILYVLANSPVCPEVKICYFVKDQEAAKNEMLAKAVTDAREKAVLLTQAGGVNLKDIQAIDYSWGEVRFESRLMECAPEAPCRGISGGSYDLDIEPDDIDMQDTVTVIWEIG